MYLKVDQIQSIQLDHTSRCNLSCPQCSRNVNGWYDRPENRNLDLTIEDYKILLAPFKNRKVRLFHCGNFGDALASPTFDETLDFCLQHPNVSISIATNGSLRSPRWYEALAKKAGDRLQIIFSVDGLEETNSIYRIGSSWKKIRNNIEAFTGSGGLARWDFIEFQHNFHQIPEARELAQELGIKVFNVKYTARFAMQNVFNGGEPTQQGGRIDLNQEKVDKIREEYGSFDNYVAKTAISCKTQKARSVFVDMHMRLWPCCWFGSPPYSLKSDPQTESFQHLSRLYGNDFNSLRKSGWDVLDHKFFQSYLQKSWNQPDKESPRIYTCGRTCGEKFEFSSGYGENTKKTKI